MIRYQITDGDHIDPYADFVQIRPGSLRAVQHAMTVHRRLLVNERADIALAAGAAGVHLRSNSLSPPRWRSILPAGFVVTVACHSLEEVLQAGGADYVLLSPVFNPLSKPAIAPALGIEYLRRVCRQSRVPVLALGGMTEERARQCMAVGAAGIAGISMFGG